jgi:hypothetical protein
MKKLEQEIVPVVLVIKIDKEKNVSDIKYMLDGENLIHDDGKEYKLFLEQALQAFKSEVKEEHKESV